MNTEPASFRDQDGYIFYNNGEIFRAINFSYQATWERLHETRFFKELVAEKKLIGFEELPAHNHPTAFKIIQPHKIPFISYPSEWTFSQLKKAALLTLRIQKKALEENFSLKDASAYNVQFSGPKPVFIDSLSFEPYRPGEPWHAYRQFCTHFLGPLLLAWYGLPDLKSLFVTHIDGLPLRLCSDLLPFRSRLNLLAYTHIHLHARLENKHADDKKINSSQLRISKKRILALIEHMEQGIRSMTIKTKKTNWTGYYKDFSYTDEGFAAKKQFVQKHISEARPALTVDLGANTGDFSAIAAMHSNYVVACDVDAEVVSAIQAKKTENILALHTDLSNPTPAYGWNSDERASFIDRIAKADFTLALALIHHLCIGNNVPLQKLAEFFSTSTQKLIIEFVPREDVQVARLLVTRKDVFADYTLENFKENFTRFFTLVEETSVPGSARRLFYFINKSKP